MELKNRIKSIPILGWFLRWINNLLRLNNLKHTVFIQQNSINELSKQIEIQQNSINELSKQIEIQQNSINELSKQIEIQQNSINELSREINTTIAKEISFQSASFQQRIDQFIFDAKIELKNAKL